jgi:VWFA-related protein
MSRSLLAATVLAAGSLLVGQMSHSQPPLAAAQEPSRPTFSTRSELVVLHATVKDRRGAYVTGLTADAFVILEDGQPQTIQFFGTQDAPVTVGLLIDGSGSMRAVRDRVIAAAGAFAETSNRADELFALTFNEHVRAVLPATAPFTGDADTLRAALTRTLVTQGRTALHDAIAAGLEYVNGGRHPGKVLVVVSDGGDNASLTPFTDVITAAQVANTVIYTIAVIDPLERGTSQKRLKELAEMTGGDAFQPRSMEQVEDVLRRIAHDIRNMYTLGYTPANTTRDTRFRRLEVRVTVANRRDLRVRTRHGYALAEP